MKIKTICIALSFALVMLLGGCASSNTTTLKDGYYTAEASDFAFGWKEFVTIYVRDGKIITVEYNAKNPSGFIKSWDMDYMRLMDMVTGTYPNQYTRTYAAELLESQDPAKVDIIAGASTSYASFQQLAEAAIARAELGDTSVAIVDISS